MRLKEFQIDTIKNTVALFDANAEVRLFGSRADDSKRGGDIDLLIFSNVLTFHDKLKILVRLKKFLGDQKIDIIISRDTQSPFVNLIYPKSVLL